MKVRPRADYILADLAFGNDYLCSCLNPSCYGATSIFWSGWPKRIPAHASNTCRSCCFFICAYLYLYLEVCGYLTAGVYCEAYARTGGRDLNICEQTAAHSSAWSTLGCIKPMAIEKSQVWAAGCRTLGAYYNYDYSNVGLGSSLRGEPGLTTFRSQGCPWKIISGLRQSDTHRGGTRASSTWQKKTIKLL